VAKARLLSKPDDRPHLTKTDIKLIVLTLDHGLYRNQAIVKWCDEAITLLKESELDLQTDET